MAERRNDVGEAVAFGMGFCVGLVAAIILVSDLTKEAWDDDVCAHDEIRARIEYRIPPEDSDQITRCIALDDYQTLDRDGQIIHPDDDR